MDKYEIADLLESKHQTLFNWLEQHNPERWETGPESKWTTGQHVLHLLQSIKPLNTALSLPRFVLKYKFGTSNRAVRDYDSIVKRYHERLKEVNGITFKGSRNMKVPKLKEKTYLLNRLQVEQKKLQHKTKKWKDNNLDNLILPHPLLGKMPVREIIMWTAYHVEHHTNTLKEKY
jgi:DinB superfamily